MRNTFFLLIISLFVFVSCKKSGTSPSTTGTGGGTTINTGITITAISPLKAYPGDVITITGTGFDPDKTKDTVTMGFNLNNTLYNNVNKLVINNKTTIISATSTEIKFTNDSAMSVSTSQGEKPVAFQLKTPGKKYLSADTMVFKDNMKFGYSWSDPVSAAWCPAAIYAGDSLYFSGKGLYPPLQVSVIGGAVGGTVPYINLTKSDLNGYQTMTGYLSINFFGNPGPLPKDCPPLGNMGITIVNGDGRQYTFRHQFFPAPNSLLESATLDATGYFQNGSKNPVVTLKGYALRSDYTLRVTGKDDAGNPFYFEKPIAAPGYPSLIITDLPLSALPPPGTQGLSCAVALKTGSGQYDIPFAYFTLYQ